MIASLLGRGVLLVATLAMFGCQELPTTITSPSMLAAESSSLLAARSSRRCENVAWDGIATIGFIEVAPGVFALGALPTPITLGDLSGVMGSVVTSLRPSGAEAQGAQHLTLRHTFESTDPLRVGTFQTEDKAVCAPAGRDQNVCRVNDVLQIVSGTGIFENAEGVLRNHGVLDLNNFTLSVSLSGRVCGDGL
jgi:hypothetical protein